MCWEIHPSEIRVQLHGKNREFGMIAYVINRIRHPSAILRHAVVSGNKKEKRRITVLHLSGNFLRIAAVIIVMVGYDTAALL